MARPKKLINVEQLEKLAEKQWNIEQIAGFFGVSRDTLERRYAANIKDARNRGAAKLTDALYARALGGKVNLPDGKIAFLASSDRLLIHALDRFVGSVPKKIELTREQAIEFLENDLKQNGEAEDRRALSEGEESHD